MRILLISIFISLCSLLFGQSQTIKDQERKASLSKGLQKIYDLTDLSEMYFSEKFYKKAVSPAREAKKLAAKMNQPELQAIATNREAKSIFKAGGTLSRKRANKLLKESLNVLPDNSNKSLRIENLSWLEKLAKLRKDEKDVYKYGKELAELTGKAPPKPPAESSGSGGLFGKRKRKLDKVIERQQQLSDSLQTLNEVSEELKTESDILQSRTAYLNRRLASERVRLKELTEEQMLQELELARQRQMLDSMDFAIALDSFQLTQQQNLLKEQKNQIRETQMKEELLQSRLNFWIALALMTILVGFGLWNRYTGIKKYSSQLEEKNSIIEMEKERSNELLLNILPARVADELKENGFAKARKFESVTVMFTDFKDFSKIAGNMAPEELVRELDAYFKKFDEIITEFGLEKIKTIGDAYMCAGGLPEPNSDHATNVVKAAGAIQKFIKKREISRTKTGDSFFEARIGIHTGPVVAGVVGEKKYAYDIWGDTVNIAARLETNCQPGSVNVSKATFEKISRQFEFESRGKIEAKNIGEVEMYYVKFS